MFNTYSPKLIQLSTWAKFQSLSGNTPILLIAIDRAEIGTKTSVQISTETNSTETVKDTLEKDFYGFVLDIGGQKTELEEAILISFWDIEKIQQFEKKLQDLNDRNCGQDRVLWSCLLTVKKETIAGFELGKMVSINYGPILNEGINKNLLNANTFDRDKVIFRAQDDTSTLKNDSKVDSQNQNTYCTELGLDKKEADKNKGNSESDKNERDQDSLAQDYLDFRKVELENYFVTCHQISRWVDKNLKNISYYLFEPYLKDDFSLVWQENTSAQPNLELFKSVSSALADSYQQNLKKLGFNKYYRKIYMPNRWTLDIRKDSETLLKEMKKNARYAIKQAQKQGIACDFAKTETQKKLALEKFYQLLQKTAKKQNFHIPKKTHFEKILAAFEDNAQIYWSYIAQNIQEENSQNIEEKRDSEHSLENCLSMALICTDSNQNYIDMLGLGTKFDGDSGNESKNEKGACEISVIKTEKNIQKHKAAYYLWAASDPEKLNNKIPAQHPVLWRAILESQKLGCSHFDFWGLDQNPLYVDREGKSYGYDTFKTGFGGFYQQILSPFFVVKSLWRFYLIDWISRFRFWIMR